MRTDTGFVVASVLLALALTLILTGAVWLGTGSWSYAGGAGLFAIEAAAPFAAWLVDRIMAG